MDNVSKIIKTAKLLMDEVNFEMAAVYFEQAADISISDGDINAAIEYLIEARNCYNLLGNTKLESKINEKIDSLRK